MFDNERWGAARVATTVGLATTLLLGGLPMTTVVTWADEVPGTVTISKTESQKGDVSYEAYRIFSGDVTTKDDGETLSNIRWADGAETAFKAAATAYAEAGGESYKGSSAQDAADYIVDHLTADAGTGIASSDSFTELLAREVAKAGITPATTMKAGEAVSLSDGYYLIVSEDDALGTGAAGTSPIFTIAGGNPVSITEKVTPPTVDKEVHEDSTDGWGRYADANRSQDVSYRLTATLPSNLASFDTYHLEFVDTLSAGLDYVDESTEVYVVHAGGTEEEVSGSFSIACKDEDDGTSTLTVDCQDIKALELESDLSTQDTIVVRYQARLNGDAAIGVPGNQNQVKLVYSNNPNVAGDGETELVDPIVYTYQLSLHKRDKDAGTDVGLAGAKFTIQVEETDGAKDTASKGRYLQADGSLGQNAHEFETDAQGNIQVQRIDAGTYVLHETQAPVGYSTTADTKVRISSTMPEGADGTIELAAEVSNNEDAELASTPDPSTGAVSVTISDAKNVGMPQTGSTGFVVLMAGGTTMVVLSLAVLLRRSKERDSQR